MFALVPGEAGEYVFFPGGFDPSGSGAFEIPNVPEGTYYLTLRDQDGLYSLFETSLSNVDLGFDVKGRADAKLASRRTRVSFEVAGLEPWRANDYLEILSAGAPLFTGPCDWPPESSRYLSDGYIDAYCDPDWSETVTGPAFLVDGAKGDVAFIYQCASKTATSGSQELEYQVATRWASLPSGSGGFTVVDGEGQTVTATLEPATMSGQLPVEWDTSQFEEAMKSGAPLARAGQHVLFVSANFYSHNDAPSTRVGWPDLLWLTVDPGIGHLTLGSLAYGQFLPEVWKEFRETWFEAVVSKQAPGAAGAGDFWITIGRSDPMPVAPGLIVPVIGPVRAPLINDMDAFEAHSGTGRTPTIAWSPPAVGTPTTYAVTLFRLEGTAGTGWSIVANVNTTVTSIAVPWGILQRGQTYFARITALREERSDPASAPLRRTWPYAWADTLTGDFTP